MSAIRIRIWHKLFLAILLVVVLILGVNLVLSQLSFQRGFSQYIEEVKLKKLDRFKAILIEHYQVEGGWGELEDNPQRWFQLQEQAELIPPPPPQHMRGGRGEPPPPFREGRPRGKDRWGGPPPQGFPPPRRGGPAAPLVGRVGLADTTKMPLVGRGVNPERQNLLPLELDGKIVGYLTVPRFAPFRSEVDHRFAHQQRKAFVMTALISLVIAALAALLLARQFNRPISKLAEMARQLTAGRFESRMVMKGQDEFGMLATDLNRLAETLEHNQKSRQQWIADISHELRTPLTVLRGELEAMEDGVRPLNVASLKSLSLEVKQLRRLVDDLYQLSLSDQGALSYQKEPVDPIALLQEVVDGYDSAMQQRSITLEMVCEKRGSRLMADPERLTQLYTNLLENSLRYTDAEGQMRVWCETEEALLIHFEDSAPGVPDDALPRLFERLYRVDASRNREYGGSGLGLSIVQSIAEAHGGTLQARQSALGGLWITLQLPLE